MKILGKIAFVALFFMLASAGARAADKPWPIDHVLGNPDAPITVIEYSSLTCPHCAKFHDDNQARFKAEWIDTGKAKLIFRDFPLDALALAAAMVAQCSGDRYFSFIDAYFHSQDTWSRASDPLAAIKNIGRLGGMTEEKLNACFANQDLMNQINARKSDAVDRYKIDSTPSFVINGKLHAGASSYDEFVKMLK